MKAIKMQHLKNSKIQPMLMKFSSRQAIVAVVTKKGKTHNSEKDSKVGQEVQEEGNLPAEEGEARMPDQDKKLFMSKRADKVNTKVARLSLGI